ncbi:hypothetical protein DY000_02025531 [Brassica cretica]|uniref:Uncharacterized protein n=1 Tax=Brassica cretica TaxID=69181 RepID=A0ABQ7E3G3_BRACR|nr:hypothetical protein DY000_02025531 [Brassica cretica]
MGNWEFVVDKKKIGLSQSVLWMGLSWLWCSVGYMNADVWVFNDVTIADIWRTISASCSLEEIQIDSGIMVFCLPNT